MFFKVETAGEPTFTFLDILFIFKLGDNCFTIYCVDLCHTETEIGHRDIHIPSLLNLPGPSHPTPTPLGCHRAPDMSRLHNTAHSHWLSILHMAKCTSQCHSPNSSHPLLPQLHSQVCSLRLHLHCCPTARFSSTILLDSIYMH